jgi:ATP synthase protein I
VIAKLSVVRVVALQVGFTAVLATVTAMALGWVEAKSVIVGALIAIIPGAYFGFVYFRETGSRAMQRTIRRAYIAEAVKLVMMGAGFALAFRFMGSLNPLALFVGFVLTHGCGIFAIAKMQSAYRQAPEQQR